MKKRLIIVLLFLFISIGLVHSQEKLLGDFTSEFKADSPVDGWSYWFNDEAPVEEKKSAKPLVWNSTLGFYCTDPEEYPSITSASHVCVAKGGGHPGTGIKDRLGRFDIYSMIRFKFLDEGFKYAAIRKASVSHTYQEADPKSRLRIIVFLNNQVLFDKTLFGTEKISFDQDFFTISKEDELWVCVGPGSDEENGPDYGASDGFKLNFEVWGK